MGKAGINVLIDVAVEDEGGDADIEDGRRAGEISSDGDGRCSEVPCAGAEQRAAADRDEIVWVFSVPLHIASNFRRGQSAADVESNGGALAADEMIKMIAARDDGLRVAADEIDGGSSGGKCSARFCPVAQNAHGGGVEIKCSARDDDVARHGNIPTAGAGVESSAGDRQAAGGNKRRCQRGGAADLLTFKLKIAAVPEINILVLRTSQRDGGRSGGESGGTRIKEIAADGNGVGGERDSRRWFG